MIKLSDFCFVYSGYAFKQFNDEKKGNPVIKIGNISANGEIDIKNCQYSEEKVNEKYISQVNDLYIALSGATTGKVGIMKLENNFYINQRVGIIRRKNENIPIDYIKHFLISKIDKILKDATGCAQPNISPKTLESYELIERNIAEMQLIADKLDKVQTLISKKYNYLNKLDELVKSQFIEMFRYCKNTTLSNIAKITMGQSPDSASYNDNQDGVPFFQGKADFGDKYTKVKHYTTQPTKIAEQNDVLMSVRAPVGPVNVASVKCCIGRGLASIRPIENKSTTEFLYCMLKSKESELAEKGTGSTFKAINKDVLINLVVPEADQELQKQFTNFVKHIDKLKYDDVMMEVA